jgi:16S rRNA (guanine966-N2)-methyltransferase
VRIIGGRWRGRRLAVPDLPGLRPTPDRVRETLFNWLAADLPGSRCLDLFAGSGALGLEAASRGAGSVLLVDRAARAVAQLQAVVRALGAAGVEVVRGEALAWLASAPGPFDVVFLDPPFGEGLLTPVCARLEALGLVREGGLVYLELEAASPAPALPAGWETLRSGRAGEVQYHLARCGGGG